MEFSEQTLINLIQHITQYTECLNLRQSKKKSDNMIQKQNYSHRIMQALLQKIQFDLLQIDSQLQQMQLHKLGKMINLLFNIVKECWLQKNHKSFCKEKQQKQINNNIICTECSAVIQKRKLKEIKQDIGFTEGTQNKYVEQANKTKLLRSDIIKELEQNGLQQNSALHTSNLNYHLNSLIQAMQTQFQCKTFNFLSENQKIYASEQVKLKEDLKKYDYKQKQLLEIETTYNQFLTKIIKQIKTPLKKSFYKMLSNWDKKKKQKYQGRFIQKSIQVFQQNEEKDIPQLTNKISELKNKLVNTQFSKQKGQNIIKNYQQIQLNLQKQLKMQKEEKNLYKQQILKLNMEASIIENKHHSAINAKKVEIEKLQNIIKDLKQKKERKQQVYNSSRRHSNNSSSKWIQQAKSSSKKIDKVSDSTIKHRPSVDFSYLYEQEKLDDKNLQKILQKSYKKVFQKRATKNYNSIPKFQHNQIKSQKQKIQSSNQVFTQQNTIQQNSFDSRQKSLKFFQIINQVDFVYNPSIQTSNNKKTKKGKSFRLNKKKQNSKGNIPQNKNSALSFSINMSNLTKPNAKKFNIKKKSLKTESQQVFEQNQKIIQNYKTSRKQRKKKDIINQANFQNKTFELENLPEIKKNDIILFGDQRDADDFEKDVGQWPNLIANGKIAIDLQNNRLILQIVKYFQHLYQNYQQKYREYLKFLTSPYTFVKSIKSRFNNYNTNNQNQIQSNRAFNPQRLKQIFIKIIRYHHINHRNCDHVEQFLKMIKFSSF